VWQNAACSLSLVNEFTAVLSCCSAAGHLSRSLIPAVRIHGSGLVAAINLIASCTIPVRAGSAARRLGQQGGVGQCIVAPVGCKDMSCLKQFGYVVSLAMVGCEDEW